MGLGGPVQSVTRVVEGGGAIVTHLLGLSSGWTRSRCTVPSPGDNDWPWPEEPELLSLALAALEQESPGAISGLARSLGFARAFENLIGVVVPSPHTVGSAEEPLGSSFHIVARTEAGADVRQSGTPPANQNSDPRRFRGPSVD